MKSSRRKKDNGKRSSTSRSVEAVHSHPLGASKKRRKISIGDSACDYTVPADQVISDKEKQLCLQDLEKIFQAETHYVIEMSYAYLLSLQAITSFTLPWKTYDMMIGFMRSYEKDILSASSAQEIDAYLLGKDESQYADFIAYKNNFRIQNKDANPRREVMYYMNSWAQVRLTRKLIDEAELHKNIVDFCEFYAKKILPYTMLQWLQKNNTFDYMIFYPLLHLTHTPLSMLAQSLQHNREMPENGSLPNGDLSINDSPAPTTDAETELTDVALKAYLNKAKTEPVVIGDLKSYPYTQLMWSLINRFSVVMHKLFKNLDQEAVDENSTKPVSSLMGKVAYKYHAMMLLEFFLFPRVMLKMKVFSSELYSLFLSDLKKTPYQLGALMILMQKHMPAFFYDDINSEKKLFSNIIQSEIIYFIDAMSDLCRSQTRTLFGDLKCLLRVLPEHVEKNKATLEEIKRILHRVVYSPELFEQRVKNGIDSGDEMVISPFSHDIMYSRFTVGSDPLQRLKSKYYNYLIRGLLGWDGYDSNLCVFLNSSRIKKKINTELHDRHDKNGFPYICFLRDVKQGEEITLDYGHSWDDLLKEVDSCSGTNKHDQNNGKKPSVSVAPILPQSKSSFLENAHSKEQAPRLTLSPSPSPGSFSTVSSLSDSDDEQDTEAPRRSLRRRKKPQRNDGFCSVEIIKSTRLSETTLHQKLYMDFLTRSPEWYNEYINLHYTEDKGFFITAKRNMLQGTILGVYSGIRILPSDFDQYLDLLSLFEVCNHEVSPHHYHAKTTFDKDNVGMTELSAKNKKRLKSRLAKRSIAPLEDQKMLNGLRLYQPSEPVSTHFGLQSNNYTRVVGSTLFSLESRTKASKKNSSYAKSIDSGKFDVMSSHNKSDAASIGGRLTNSGIINTQYSIKRNWLEYVYFSNGNSCFNASDHVRFYPRGEYCHYQELEVDVAVDIIHNQGMIYRLEAYPMNKKDAQIVIEEFATEVERNPLRCCQIGRTLFGGVIQKVDERELSASGSITDDQGGKQKFTKAASLSFGV